MHSLLSSSTVQSCFEPQLSAASGWSSLCTPDESMNKPFASLRAPPHVTTTFSKRVSAPGGKKSLDMCTETLGCETGTVDAVGDDLSLKRGGDAAAVEERKRRARKEMVEGRIRRVDVGNNFPPPLTTFARASRVRIVHKRQDGRLSMYAVWLPAMEAERSDGRLRLRLLPCSHGNIEGDSHAIKLREEVYKIEEENSKDMDEEEEYLGIVGEDMKGEVLKDNAKMEKEMDIAKYTRAGRCIEEEGGARRRTNRKWEAGQAFWVAS